jgi:hypothetical protein
LKKQKAIQYRDDTINDAIITAKKIPVNIAYDKETRAKAEKLDVSDFPEILNFNKKTNQLTIGDKNYKFDMVDKDNEELKVVIENIEIR